ncbi:MAG: GNAT family N-acetyltransferase [Gemmatimonadales bacterium]
MTPIIRQVTDPSEAPLEDLAALLIDSVHGGASVGFLAPLALPAAIGYWTDVVASLRGPVRLWIAEDDGRIVGSVQLALCEKPNGTHRAEVQKLLVHTAARGRGVASRLMAAIDRFAVANGRTLLYLDTEAGSAAESVYRHLGWKKTGEIPNYATSPDGTPCATAIYYKLGAAPPSS